jgi:hypothetical protein
MRISSGTASRPRARTRPSCATCAFSVAIVVGCGSSPPASLDVGRDQAPALSFEGGTGTGPAAVSVSITPASPTVCRGSCVTLAARASGGTAPYTFDWGGVPDAGGGAMRVCPDETTTYSVTATDSSGHTGELAAQGAVGTARATVMVSTMCSDAGLPPVDATCDAIGEPPPEAGHYVGTVSCGAGSQWMNYGPGEGGITVQDAGGGTLGSIQVDLAVDPSTGRPTGTWYFDWNLLVIAGAGSLQGTFVCDGSEVSATFVDSQWGLPASNMTVIPTGLLTGGLTAARAPGPSGTISGFFTYTSFIGTSQSDVCVGSYTATLQTAGG